MHLPHRASRDNARDLRVLIFNIKSCGENGSVPVSKVENVTADRIHVLTVLTYFPSPVGFL